MRVSVRVSERSIAGLSDLVDFFVAAFLGLGASASISMVAGCMGSSLSSARTMGKRT